MSSSNVAKVVSVDTVDPVKIVVPRNDGKVVEINVPMYQFVDFMVKTAAALASSNQMMYFRFPPGGNPVFKETESKYHQAMQRQIDHIMLSSRLIVHNALINSVGDLLDPFVYDSTEVVDTHQPEVQHHPV